MVPKNHENPKFWISLRCKKCHTCPKTAKYIALKSAKIIQILLGYLPKFYKKTNFRGGGGGRSNLDLTVLEQGYSNGNRNGKLLNETTEG